MTSSTTSGRLQLSDRLDGIGVADHGIDVHPGRVLDQRHGQLHDHLGFVGVRIPVRPRDQQRHAARTSLRPPAHLVEQPRRRCGAVRNDQDMWLTLRHGAIVPPPLPGGTNLIVAERYLPVQVGARFWRNAVIPSWASAASAFSVITVLVCS